MPSIEQYRKVKELTGCNIRVLNVKYLGPTDTKGARIKIIDRWFNQSVTMPYNYEYCTALQGAVHYLVARGWNVTGVNTTSSNNQSIVIIGNWDSSQQLRGEK